MSSYRQMLALTALDFSSLVSECSQGARRYHADRLFNNLVTQIFWIQSAG
jgi:hypothetical protein